MIKQIITTTTLIAAAAMASAATEVKHLDMDAKTMSEIFPSGTTPTIETTGGVSSTLGDWANVNGALWGGTTGLSSGSTFAGAMWIKSDWDVTNLGSLAQTGKTGNQYLLTFGDPTVAGNFGVAINTNGELAANVEGKGAVRGGSITKNTWTHIGFIFYSGTLQIFQNGSMVGGRIISEATSVNLMNDNVRFAEKTQRMTSGASNWTGGVDDLYLWNIESVADGTTAIQTAYAAAIPEPSMFGLLAGLGALALVGARRRRK